MTTIRIIFWLIVVGVIGMLIANQLRKNGKSFPWGVALATVLLLGLGSCVYKYAKTPKKSSTTAPIAVQSVKALVLRFDGFTPCEPEIQFAFELDTQGDPISLKFPGVPTSVEYSGKGTLNAPERRTSGPVRITSLDSRKQARVRIWEVVTVPVGQ